jgi:allantoinase
MQRLDIGIRNGRIACLTASIPASEAEAPPVDAQGCWVLPGVIDAHVHLNEPGMGAWEGFDTGSAALAAGGVTTYIDMPLNGLPPTVDAKSLELKLAAAQGQSHVDYALWGGLVPWNLDRLEELARAGVVGYKAFMSNPGGVGEGAFQEVDEITLFEGMSCIARMGGVLALHAESEAIVSKLASRSLAAGKTAAADFAASRPVLAELEAVNRALLFAELTGCALHFVHISSSAAVKRIMRAKEWGLSVTVETCPHYLVLTDEDMGSLGPVAKCAPPLRNRKEQERLWSDVRSGRIDWIASDHSPCPTPLKQQGDGNYFAAWGGISGAQSTLELMITEGVLRRGIPPRLISRMLSEAPARRFGLYPHKGIIAVGADADLVVLDTDMPYTLAAGDLLYRHTHSPYVGYRMGCRVKTTVSRGAVVYELGRGIVTPGRGKWLRPLTGFASAVKKEGIG